MLELDFTELEETTAELELKTEELEATLELDFTELEETTATALELENSLEEDNTSLEEETSAELKGSTADEEITIPEAAMHSGSLEQSSIMESFIF